MIWINLAIIVAVTEIVISASFPVNGLSIGQVLIDNAYTDDHFLIHGSFTEVGNMLNHTRYIS